MTDAPVCTYELIQEAKEKLDHPEWPDYSQTMAEMLADIPENVRRRFLHGEFTDGGDEGY
jgi:hypothetical protein